MVDLMQELSHKFGLAWVGVRYGAVAHTPYAALVTYLALLCPSGGMFAANTLRANIYAKCAGSQ